MSENQHSDNPYYDVVVIGGGIQGCGCAQAIAAAGYSVLLVEQHQLAAGTSSRSSKLIHGGLRYLETGQFSLVRKSLNERALLTRLAPELVELKTFYLPVYQNSRLGQWKLGAGLALYSLLGNLRSDSRFGRVPRAEWGQLGGLKQDQLRCVYRYSDAQTNDVLLTRAVAKSAKDLGAEIRENCRFELASRLSSGQISVELSQRGQATSASCAMIVNAAGPWVSEVQQRIDFVETGPSVDLVQGSHIELDQRISDAIFYVESPIDGRAVFVMPWPSGTLIGTTEKAHTGDPASSAPSEEEVDYLLKTAQHYFPDVNGNISNSWAGLRVLPKAAQSTTSGIPRPFSGRARDTIIHCDDKQQPSTLSLYGGKLTAYRTTAADVAEKAGAALRQRGISPSRPAQNTADIPL